MKQQQRKIKKLLTKPIAGDKMNRLSLETTTKKKISFRMKFDKR